MSRSIRYIKITISPPNAYSGQEWGITEIAAYPPGVPADSGPAAPTNLATAENRCYGKTVTSNYSPTGGTLSIITDGNCSTGNFCGFTPSTTPLWVMVDMGALYDIEAVMVQFVNPTQRRLNNFKLEVSADNVTWSTIQKPLGCFSYDIYYRWYHLYPVTDPRLSVANIMDLRNSVYCADSMRRGSHNGSKNFSIAPDYVPYPVVGEPITTAQIALIRDIIVTSDLGYNGLNNPTHAGSDKSFLQQVVSNAIAILNPTTAEGYCTTCSFRCVAECSGFCFQNCSVTCGINCDATCTYTCNSYCRGTCTNGCSVSTCTSTCGTSCVNTCGANCTNTCGGACAAGCGTTCHTGCSGACASGCTASTCSGGCWANCKANCYSIFSSNCTTANCNYTCQNTGCKVGCGTVCSGSCGATCSTTCGSGCTNSCGGACKTACHGVCIGGCTAACTGTCNSNCSSTCRDDCNTYCKGACYSMCSRSTCGTVCALGCETSCSSSCSTGCSIKCGSLATHTSF